MHADCSCLKQLGGLPMHLLDHENFSVNVGWIILLKTVIDDVA